MHLERRDRLNGQLAYCTLPAMVPMIDSGIAQPIHEKCAGQSARDRAQGGGDLKDSEIEVLPR